MNLSIELNEELLQDCINIATGLFHPLTGFLSSADYHSVVNNMTLADGSVWTIPISLELEHDAYIQVADLEKLQLNYKSKKIGYLKVDDCYAVDIEKDIFKIYGTNDLKHPGVINELKKGKYRVGGKVNITDQSLLEGNLNPKDTKAYFKSNNWKTIAGFQTRNPIHKAHEYLQRVALEVCDGLFINPLVGWKKIGDFSEEAVVNGYEKMIEEYYPGLNIYFNTLKTPMRYAGPKEAIFHAIIRRNLGCTHFIIGRDHAGVGNYYGKYEAHELAREIIKKNNIGIELLLFSEPFYCHKCGQIVSDSTCHHDAEYVEKISGTIIRSMLDSNKRPSELYMRPEIADSIIELRENKFINN
jgi:sulfate adenylyltransferase